MPLPVRLPAGPGARALLVLVTLAAACTHDAARDPGEPGDLPAPAPATDQDLAVAVGQDPFLAPADPPTAESSGTPMDGLDIGLRTDGPNPGVFETLTRVTPAFGVGPGLAEGWEEHSPTRWRFLLRSGVSFHDGTVFDARAVVENLDTLARRQDRPRGLEAGAVTVVDDHTVDVELTHPNLRLPEQLADPSTGITAPGTRAGVGDEPSSTPTGTGPFRFVSYTPGDELVVEAFDDYWDGPPRLDSLTLLFGPDDDASRRLATREALAVGHIPGQHLARVSGRVDRRVTSSHARAAYLLMNVSGSAEWATLQELAVRRAVAMAIDRQAFTRQVWPDGEPNDTLIPPVVLDGSDDALSAPAHDREAARRLLDDAGWHQGDDGVRRRDGTPLELSLIVADPGELNAAAATVEEQLAKAGISVARDHTGHDPDAGLGRMNEGSFDLFLDLRTQNDANPCALCRFFSVRPGGQLTFAGAVGAGPEADALFEESFTAASIDSARRWAAELMTVVVEDEVVAVPLASLPNAWLISPHVQSFDPSALPGAQRWDHVWLAE